MSETNWKDDLEEASAECAQLADDLATLSARVARGALSPQSVAQAVCDAIGDLESINTSSEAPASSTSTVRRLRRRVRLSSKRPVTWRIPSRTRSSTLARAPTCAPRFMTVSVGQHATTG